VRTFEPTGGSTYISYGDDRVYLDGRILLGGKLTIHGAASFDYLNFRGATTGKDQFNVAFDLGLDYEIKPWVNVGGGSPPDLPERAQRLRLQQPVLAPRGLPQGPVHLLRPCAGVPSSGWCAGIPGPVSRS
jgi:hypothetical protein